MKKFTSFYTISAAMVLLLSASYAYADTKVDPKVLANGKKLYVANCAVCHGEKGDGNGPAGAVLNPKPRNFIKDKFKAGKTPEKIANTIANGLPGTAMVSYKHVAPKKEDQLAIAHYVLTFSAPANAKKK